MSSQLDRGFLNLGVLKRRGFFPLGAEAGTANSKNSMLTCEDLKNSLYFEGGVLTVEGGSSQQDHPPTAPRLAEPGSLQFLQVGKEE
jgi:hypothetical protein